MKSFTALTLLSAALSLTASALTINKARNSPDNGPSFTVEITTSDGDIQDVTSSYGAVGVSFDPSSGIFLTEAAIIDESTPFTATCKATDAMGNQVRAFGGPQFGDVESVEFVPADGKQITYLSCHIAAQ